MKLSKTSHIILLCGHYEGIDQRVIDEIVDEEISIGNYVLTGGEFPAMVLMDSVSRYIEGVVMDIIKSIEHEQLKNKIPVLDIGNTVRVHVTSKSLLLFYVNK